ncbi:MAG: SDR family NAD(P)-dependent oxidoreductase [Kineosporiaceae bacterium]|nr:SDR family NAD(P)-dependent oxidoreductase [Aeromicrobium sp.]
MTDKRLSGRVAVVTGAGGGLGRSHALELARHGAHVVVNDVVDPGQVVKEIVTLGGSATASHDGVDSWDGGAAIIATAVDTYGRIDIVVNNAGVLRDKSFGKLESDMVRDVMAVHLDGAFHVSKAAWPHLVKQGSGRIVMTSSGSGLYGNIGQANYGAAKMGLVGLMRVLALEGARSGIQVNAIAPLARSQMTEGVLPEEILERLSPEWVSPLVAWLASDECVDSGHIYSVAGGYYARVAVVEGPGIRFDHVPTLDELAEAHERLVAVEPFTEPKSLSDQVSLTAKRR